MSSDLLPCSPIGSHHIQRNDAARIVVVDQLIFHFSPIEYQLMVLLLRGQAVSDTELMQTAFGSEAALSPRKNLEKHLEKIRSKLYPAGLGICRVAKFGYILLALF